MRPIAHNLLKKEPM